MHTNEREASVRIILKRIVDTNLHIKLIQNTVMTSYCGNCNEYAIYTLSCGVLTSGFLMTDKCVNWLERQSVRWLAALSVQLTVLHTVPN
jgi:hypothetical protein